MFNINGRSWRVRLVPSNHSKLFKSNKIKALGSCDDKMSIIYIDRQLDEEKLYKVLCHEITHAFMFSYHIKLNLEQQELVADIISNYGIDIIEKTDLIFKQIKK